MNKSIIFLSQPWPWYISGPFIALIMFALLFAGRRFGMSSNLRTLCAIGGAGKVSDFFIYEWKLHRWNLLVVVGAIVGGFLASHYLANDGVAISTNTIETLKGYGINGSTDAYLPEEIFGLDSLSSTRNIIILLLGGILVGFGARYADGCTSGHAISGLSNLQLPSLIAVIGFFIGGLVMIHFIYPLIFQP